MSIVVAIALALSGAAFLALPAAAEEPEPITVTDAQKVMLDDFARWLVVNPPQMELVAGLEPPTTTYLTRMTPMYSGAIYEQIKPLKESFAKAGEPLEFDADKYSDVDWVAEISCGTWRVNVVSWGLWSHPNGTGKGECPHPGTQTSHPGTIKAGGVFHVHLYAWGKKQQYPVRDLLEGNWSYTCTYSGSETGKAPCESTLKDFKSPFIDNGANMKAAGQATNAAQPAGSNQPAPSGGTPWVPIAFGTAGLGGVGIVLRKHIATLLKKISKK